jgi:arylsulfatase
MDAALDRAGSAAHRHPARSTGQVGGVPRHSRKHTLEYDFKYDGLGAATFAFNSTSGLGRSGTGVLKVDGREVTRKTLPRTIPLTLQWDENFDVGADTLTGVDDQDYQPPFRFTGKLDGLTLTIDRPKLTPDNVKRLEAALARAADQPA